MLSGLLVSWGVPGSVAWAQPQIDEESRTLQLEQTARYTWRALQLQTSPIEPKETLRAIAVYQKFYDEATAAGALPVDVAVAVTSRIAQLYGRELEDFAKAKEIYAWALKQWGDTPYQARLQREAEQMAKLTERPGPTAADKVPQKAGAEVAPIGVAIVEPVKIAEVPFGVGAVRTVNPPTMGDLKASFPFGMVGAIGPDLTKRTGIENVAIKSGVVENGSVKSGDLELVVTLEEMRTGRLSAAEAWKRGLLDEDSVIVALSEPGLQIGSDRGYSKSTNPRDYGLRQKVVTLLLEHSGKRLDRGLTSPQSLPWQVQASVEHFYRDQSDVRVVAWYEAALAHSLKQGRDASESAEEFNQRVFYLIEPLAGYYAQTGQREQAAQTWERVPQMMGQRPLAHPALTGGWWVPDALVEAARSYRAAGDEQKAKELYAQVPQYGDGWLTVLSFYDQALPLIQAGKLDEAKAILSRPIAATRSQSEGTIAQNAWLASLAYQQGDLEAAMRYGKKVEAFGKPDQNTRVPVKNLYEMGLDIYNRAGGWRKQPIQSDTKEVVFQANTSQPDRPLYARFRIKTYGDTSVTATVDNPAFQARVLPIDNWQREGLNAHELEMEVVVTTSLNRPVANVPLVLSSATRGKTTTVRLSLADKPTQPTLTTGG